MWWNAYFKDKVRENLPPLQPLSKLAKFSAEFWEIGDYLQPFSKLAKLITEFGEIADYLQPSSNLSPNSAKITNQLTLFSQKIDIN